MKFLTAAALVAFAAPALADSKAECAAKIDTAVAESKAALDRLWIDTENELTRAIVIGLQSAVDDRAKLLRANPALFCNA
jgi:hypothetical protein